LVGRRIPIVADTYSDPEKGSGIAMICTFGDLTDVTWWRELSLPVRAVIQSNGTLKPVAFGGDGWPSRDAAAAQGAYDQLAMAYGRKGDLAHADLASAQATFTRGDAKTARQLAARAKTRLPVGSPAWVRADDIVNVKLPKTANQH
jgi:valyl-tRNA synthetase